MQGLMIFPSWLRFYFDARHQRWRQHDVPDGLDVSGIGYQRSCHFWRVWPLCFSWENHWQNMIGCFGVDHDEDMVWMTTGTMMMTMTTTTTMMTMLHHHLNLSIPKRPAARCNLNPFPVCLPDVGEAKTRRSKKRDSNPHIVQRMHFAFLFLLPSWICNTSVSRTVKMVGFQYTRVTRRYHQRCFFGIFVVANHHEIQPRILQTNQLKLQVGLVDAWPPW